MNLKDFPSSELEKYDIKAQHPDDFIMELFDLNQPMVLNAFKEDRMHYTKPPFNTKEYLYKLERQGLVNVVAYLNDYVGLV